ncbi:high-affinity nickel-transport protein [Zhihengliuella halotolerans]|uniref:Nickel/cobalt efflux system n=1 Tax=Zhihengliuella halotolerans TaxID=370736 RepID=A0A4Q8ADD3_9MICC|nr:high-affinity nickel-transport protein [Zhihengliuella halotolerans]
MSAVETPAARRAGTIRMAAAVVLLNIIAWGLFFGFVLPHDYLVSDQRVFGVGIAVTAFMLGARHAFDADHIAAIDNTTRALIHRGRPHASTGFWFALGHSTVVVAAVAGLGLGFHLLAGQLSDDGSALKSVSGIWGPAVAGTFLVVIGLINLQVLVDLMRALRRWRDGEGTPGEYEEHLQRRGLLARLVAPLAARVDSPVKLYPLGLLFGLGLDTAATIGLFVISGGAAVALPWQAMIALPLLFTAGMVLCDSVNGALMGGAYRWAAREPHRKAAYSVGITTLSVLVAFWVGAVVLSGLASEVLGLDGGAIAWLGSLEMESFGLVTAGLFVLAWAVSWLVWRAGRAAPAQVSA